MSLTCHQAHYLVFDSSVRTAAHHDSTLLLDHNLMNLSYFLLDTLY